VALKYAEGLARVTDLGDTKNASLASEDSRTQLCGALSVQASVHGSAELASWVTKHGRAALLDAGDPYASFWMASRQVRATMPPCEQTLQEAAPVLAHAALTGLS
jgi:hypothetical protein